MRRMSPRWAFPVVSPWKARRHGTPVALLSARQHVLNVTLRLAYRGHTRQTQEELARLLDNPSRGRVHHNLARLRQLEVFGFRSRRGRLGYHAIWIPRASAALSRTLAGVRLPSANDSASTLTGTFLSARGLANAWRPVLERHRGGAPPRTPRRRAVPRTLWSRCPAGHWTPLARSSWRGPFGGTLDGLWSGPCRRCGAETVERIHLEVPIRVSAELEVIRTSDPERWAKLVDHARHLVADPRTPARERERLLAEYLERGDRAVDDPDRHVESAGDVAAELMRRIRPDG